MGGFGGIVGVGFVYEWFMKYIVFRYLWLKRVSWELCREKCGMIVKGECIKRDLKIEVFE